MPSEATFLSDTPDTETFVFPASFAQQRLWLVDQLSPGKAVYNIPYHHQTRLRGALNVAALTQAVQELIARHEPLRTTFTTEDGEIMQVIAPPHPVELPLLDISHLLAPEREAEMHRLINAEGRHLFDLAQGPLFYVKLIRLAPDDHVFIFVVHHIIVDGLSLDYMAEELAALYQAFAAGQPSPLLELPLQYADFVIWQREWMQGEVRQAQLDYWLNQLQGELPVSRLPTDRPRPRRQENNGTWLWLHLPPELISQLKTFSRQEGVSLYMTLLAGFKALLHRYSGQNDITVSSPTANRTQPELEKLIAFFINPVVLRTNLADDPSFRVYLQQVRQVALGAFAHQELPFEQLVEALQPPRDLSYHPLFQISFTLQSAPILMCLPGLTAEPVEFNNGTAAFDLTAELWETAEGGVSGRWEYDTALFDRATMKRLMRHYAQLLGNLVAAPDTPISRVPLLATAELGQLLHGWNATERDYPRDACLHHLFEQQAITHPERVALDYKGQTMTYAALNERANQLAHYLQQMGIEPDQFVGLCVERSPDMMIGLLGILKAGGAYLPLDPDYPTERLAFMLADTQAPVLLTQASLVNDLPPHHGRVVQLDKDWDEIATCDKNNPMSQTTAVNLAYVIHTSGSTGKPKGVLIPHRNVVNFLETMREEPGLSAADNLLAVTTLSFDIAVLELFLPLVTGARVVLASREEAMDGQRLAAMLHESHISVMQATPATWQLLLNAGWQPDGQLKMLSGGEALPRKLANELLVNGGELWNMYGPTETTIWSSVWRVTAGEEPILIGRPIANTQMYILDKHLHPVPLGVTGELYIGGDGVAQGYLNRPELTSERFVAAPFGGDHDHAPPRIYRTGDLARYLPDGTIECLGRVDFQVKVRGFRIELGEIETVLNQHTAVQQAVVVAQGQTANDQRLVAYIIPETETEAETAITPAALRQHLAAHLPQYMIPAYFLTLDKFPLTPNGKVNRLALPAPETSRTTQSYIPPQTAMEQKLSALWQELLGAAQVGKRANFFELGGHSLLATQMLTRLRQELAVDMPLATLFESPTLEEFSQQIEVAHWSTQTTTAVVEPDDDEREEFEL